MHQHLILSLEVSEVKIDLQLPVKMIIGIYYLKRALEQRK